MARFSSLVARTFKINFLFPSWRSLYSSKLIIIQIFLIPYRASQNSEVCPCREFHLSWPSFERSNSVLFHCAHGRVMEVHKERQVTPEELEFLYHPYHSGWWKTFCRHETVGRGERKRQWETLGKSFRKGKKKVPFLFQNYCFFSFLSSLFAVTFHAWMLLYRFFFSKQQKMLNPLDKVELTCRFCISSSVHLWLVYLKLAKHSMDNR